MNGVGQMSFRAFRANMRPVNRKTGHHIEIIYCTQCRWLLRAAWMAQELLTTFEDDIAELSLRPASGGTFEVHTDGTCVWSRRLDGGFPEITELKRRVRDRIAPDRDLGHIDKQTGGTR